MAHSPVSRSGPGLSEQKNRNEDSGSKGRQFDWSRFEVLVQEKGITEINTKQTFARARQLLLMHGLPRLRKELGEFVDSDEKMLEVSTDLRYNAFSRMAAGKVALDPEIKDMQRFLDRYTDPKRYGKYIDFGQDFLVLKNLVARAVKYTSNALEADANTASMSKRHEFLISKDLRWQNFNVLTIGMDGDKQKAVDMLKEMKMAAQHYCRTSPQNWSTNVKFFFHCHPFCKMKTLHLHMVDEMVAGETMDLHAHAHLSIDDVIKVLQHEIKKPTSVQQLSANEKDATRRARLY